MKIAVEGQAHNSRIEHTYKLEEQTALQEKKLKSPTIELTTSKKYTVKEEAMKRNWKAWWKAAGIRAVKTVAQTAVATIGTAAVLEGVNWIMVLSASALAGVLSLLTSVAGLPECSTQNAEEG